jgi:FlaA1/EpsC-like NDP-sugar epimerase
LNTLIEEIRIRYATTSKLHRKLLLISFDVILILSAYIITFILSEGVIFPYQELIKYIKLLPILIIVTIITMLFSGMYRPFLRYAGLEFFNSAIRTVLICTMIVFLICFFFRIAFPPRFFFIVYTILIFNLICFFRLIARWLIYSPDSPLYLGKALEPILIWGAGETGSSLVEFFKRDKDYRVCGIIDDNFSQLGRSIQGVKIHLPSKLKKLIEKHTIEKIFLSLPSATFQQRQAVLKKLEPLGLHVMSIPHKDELIDQRGSISDFRELNYLDLLEREPVSEYPELIKSNIEGKVVMVTGAGGSIGSEIARIVQSNNPKKIILMDHSEYSLYKIDIELIENQKGEAIYTCLGSITDYEMISQIMNKHQIETIYHAAAYKHVPMVEANIPSGILNNVLGTLQLCLASIANDVETFALISSDKAVRPTNVMGATKRCAELILQSLAELTSHENLHHKYFDLQNCKFSDVDIEPITQTKTISKTKFIMVRFGNVFASNGSVIERWRQQIIENQPLTVTHEKTTRFFMTIKEASSLVIQAGAMGKGGEVFLLEMGEPVNIYDLANRMIRFYGRDNTSEGSIEITGMRPGEKLHEELLIDVKASQPSSHKKIYFAHEYIIPWNELQHDLTELFHFSKSKDENKIKEILKKLVHGFPG